MATLPLQVWAEVAQHLALQEPHFGEQWIFKKTHLPIVHPQNPLHQLRQVSRGIRDEAMRAMWGNVKLEAVNEEIRRIMYLEQLAARLAIGNSNNGGSLRGAADYVQKVEIHWALTLPLDAGCPFTPAGVIADEYPWIAMAHIEPGYRHDKLSPDSAYDDEDIKKPDAFMLDFTRSLQNWTRLRELHWISPIFLTSKALSHLSSIASLEKVLLDFRGSEDRDVWDFFYEDAKEKAAPPAAGKLSHVSLFVDDSVQEQTSRWGDRAEQDKCLTASTKAIRQGTLADWLVSLPSLQHLTLSGTELLRCDVMVPVWAHITKLDFCDGSVHNNPSLSAARYFRELLQRLLPDLRVVSREPYSAGRLVFELIHNDDALHAWREWFSQWPGENKYEKSLSTCVILDKAAQAALRSADQMQE